MPTDYCGDGNRVDGDGCSRRCTWEIGFVCSGDPGEYTCRPTVCGDGAVEGDETCDDGNTVGGDGCSADCRVDMSCGDGVFAADLGEGCDDGNIFSGDGCSSSCQVELGYECHQESPDAGPQVCDTLCGDGLVKGDEECDDGVNDGGYGECAPGCRLGPRCGDGLVNGPETCDDGQNDGGYGECAPGCVFAVHCGDGIVQPSFEECDYNAPDKSSSCTRTCRIFN